MKAYYYYNRTTKTRTESAHHIKNSLSMDLIEITELEYILLGLVSRHSSAEFTSALSKAYNLLDGIDSESK